MPRIAGVNSKMTGGKQPVHRKIGDNEWSIVCDGTLYGTEDLRRKFSVDSDEEIILLSYIEWGERCLERLNGVFAFAIWDDSNQSLFIARDHLGVKPLFWTITNNELIFASEIKTILSHPDVEPVIDNNGLAEIFALAPTRTPGVGVFKNIHQLKPAHFLKWVDNNLIVRRYWEFMSYKHEDSLSTTAEQLKQLLKKTVQLQMKAEEPVATMLSGGLDSSSITAICSNEYAKSGERLTTFSFDYKDNTKFFKRSNFQPDSDEKWVRRVSSEFSTNHIKLVADTNDLISELYDAVIARDLPGMADIDSSLLHFCKCIKKTHSVALSGECADEILGGYPWFHSSKAFETPMFPWAHNISERLNLLTDEAAAYVDGENYANQRYFETLEKTPRLLGESSHEARRREIFYLNIAWFGANLIERTERMAHTSGLEIRMPFADYKLAQYAWNIPWDMKALSGREKGILRLALKGILPDDVLERKKSPYPKTHNPTYERAVKDNLREVLSSRKNKITPLINKEVIESLMEEKSEISKPFFGQLMSRPQMYAFLLQVNFWLEHYNVSIR